MDPKAELSWGLPEEEGVGELIDQLATGEAGDDDTRAEAAFALGQIGDPRAVEPLIAALRDEDTVVRTEAAAALGALGDRRAVEPLIRALYDTQWEVRSNAALSLGALGDHRAFAHLLTTLYDANEEVRFWTARALGDLGDPAALPALQQMQQQDRGTTPEGPIQAAAAQAIASIQEKGRAP
ncbi:MAG TPA: HEAT repeat domain-containing protein [Chloroflexia bacterium]|nr:HEAT repeat domain-containing protein [Chloroflexia bacterium]